MHPHFMYKGEPIQVVQSFKYLGIRWNVCYESRLLASRNSYYAFENQYKQSDTQGWEMRLMLFNALVDQVFLHKVVLWGGAISLGAWNEIKNIQILFLHRQLRAKSSTSYLIMLLEIGGKPIEVIAM